MTKKPGKTPSPILRDNSKVKRFAHRGMRYSRTRFTERMLTSTKNHAYALSGGKIGEGLLVSSRARSRNRGPRAEKQAKIYIGLVGEKGGGKDTAAKIVAELLPKKKTVQIRFSDVLTDTLNIWALPRTRENYQKLSPSFRKVYGPHALANAVRVRGEASTADIVLLNGVRWWEDVKMLRSLNKKGAHSFLVYVTAPAKLRYERMRKRGEKAEEKKATLAQFMKEEKAYTEIFIPKIGRRADVKIENSGSYEDLREAVRRQILPRITGKKPS